MLIDIETPQPRSLLYMVAVYILIANDMDVVRAVPDLIVQVHHDKMLMPALLLTTGYPIDLDAAERFDDERLTVNLARQYLNNVAYDWSKRKEVGNGSDL
jgi:hypothetical protein